MTTWIVALALAGVAQAQSVTSSASCPGEAELAVSGIGEGGSFVVMRGDGPGSDVIPGGPCAGLFTGLDGLSWFGPFAADADGEAVLTPTVPADAGVIQVMDIETCAMSEVVPVCELDCDPAFEVAYLGACYTLDGSGGACDPGYRLAPQSILFDIAEDFVGKDYKNTVSENCCIQHADEAEELQDWGMVADCNEPGPFVEGPVYGGSGCTDARNDTATQLTLCMRR